MNINIYTVWDELNNTLFGTYLHQSQAIAEAMIEAGDNSSGSAAVDDIPAHLSLDQLCLIKGWDNMADEELTYFSIYESKVGDK